ncbi:hypothetical protein JWJ90_00555 [Desulfobulbus rhabdoformis]|jgi:hypothetical protein|uniref:hypothetical protein n=1 Tax=Desulfobulbus rhabdoformis TaxID=34032 RepID=UPI0019657849|nr:hypothetical protein [Desulfobulbus rhabdoformis]MBM9612770.1 hypothetical protein [Desulfobulbus rhabdoformis]
MNKQKQLRFVNPALAVLLALQALSGMLHDVLPNGVFEVLHSCGWALVVLAVYHVYLNWPWVQKNILPTPNK